MIRPLSFLCLAAACGSGLYLYSEKHRAELLDRQITRAIHETEAARQTTAMLRAEWGLLNNPDRLRPMAEKYLNLASLQPSQWVQLADLGARLPAVVPQNTAGGGTDDGAAATDDASSAADTPMVAAPADPGIQDAALAPPPKPATAVHATAAAKPAVRVAPRKPLALADGDTPMHGNPLVHSSPLALATPQPARARVLSALARPTRLHVAQPAVVTVMPSALGSAMSLHASVPAPVPLGAE